ncbi:MAG: aldose epimerase [Thermoleophilia bacterium]|nr:aldose epimerase [Thermoleophilia bacterium]
MPATLPTGRQFTISRGDARATVVELGGGIRSYVADGRELLDGFGEDETVSSSRGQVLAPWPNRIDGGAYEWDGADHQLPLSEPAKGNAAHGLLRFTRWECAAHTDDEVTLSQLLLPQPGYPFSLAVEVRYRLTSRGLDVTTTARNVGSRALPYASGQHPYLAAPNGGLLDACTVQLRADTFLPADERGIPTQAESVDGSQFDLREPRAIGDLQLDTAYTDLERDAEGRAAATLLGPDASGTQLWVDESYSWLQLFTGDTLAPERRRRGLAAEPMTAPANAFRSGTDVTRLEPGQAHTACWGLLPIRQVR